jgi:hypothetical protein
MRKFLYLFLFGLSVPGYLSAQGYNYVPRFEAGLQLDFASLGPVGLVGGVGGRFHYNFTNHYALDTEITYHQQDVSPANNFLVPTVALGQTNAFAGLRAGFREENVGAFFRARAGALHFDAAHGAQLLTRRNVPALDVGITVERYRGPMILRADLGEWIMFAGNATVPTGFPPAPTRLGTRLSFSLGLGAAIRF